MNAMGMRPGIILLREGTDTSQGKPQLISNINACQAIADVVRTTLGPAGRDKLVTGTNGQVTISNDGATLMKLLEISHPAAKTLVDISLSQDAEVGDGTTTVVLLAAEILAQVKALVEANIHPAVLMHHLRQAGQWAVERVQEMALNCATGPRREEMLLKTASTALNSKLIAQHKDLFAPMVVQAIEWLYRPPDEDSGASPLAQPRLADDLRQWIAIKKIPGGDVRQSFLVHGVAFPKTFSYAGFEQMTKRYENPLIVLLNVELELKSEKENAEVRISTPDDYNSIVEAEWQVLYDKLQACVAAGAQIVLSKLPIGDVATQYFADRGLFCAGRVTEADLKRVAQATGASIQTSTSQLDKSVLGTCGLFEERQVGDQRFNIFTQCPTTTRTSTLILRGGTEQFIAESERSLHDALMVVKRSLQSGSVVAGGGAVEMELSHMLRQRALTMPGKGQMIVTAYAKALEVIPRQLCDNAGFDATDILSELRRKHAQDREGGKWYGVDLINGAIADTMDLGIWEPSDNKRNAIEAATEAACVILSIDETVIAPRSQDPGAAATGMMDGDGMPMTNMMNNAMSQASGGARTGKLAPGVSYMKGRGGG